MSIFERDLKIFSTKRIREIFPLKTYCSAIFSIHKYLGNVLTYEESPELGTTYIYVNSSFKARKYYTFLPVYCPTWYFSITKISLCLRPKFGQKKSLSKNFNSKFLKGFIVTLWEKTWIGGEKGGRGGW